MRSASRLAAQAVPVHRGKVGALVGLVAARDVRYKTGSIIDKPALPCCALQQKYFLGVKMHGARPDIVTGRGPCPLLAARNGSWILRQERVRCRSCSASSAAGSIVKFAVLVQAVSRRRIRESRGIREYFWTRRAVGERRAWTLCGSLNAVRPALAIFLSLRRGGRGRLYSMSPVEASEGSWPAKTWS